MVYIEPKAEDTKNWGAVNEVFTECGNIEKLAYHALTTGEYEVFDNRNSGYDQGVIIFDHIFADCASKIANLVDEDKTPRRVKKYILDNHGDLSTVDKIKTSLFQAYAKNQFDIFGIIDEIYGKGTLKNLIQVDKGVDIHDRKKNRYIFNEDALLKFCETNLHLDTNVLKDKLQRYRSRKNIVYLLNKPLCLSSLEKKYPKDRELIEAESNSSFSRIKDHLDGTLFRSSAFENETRKLILKNCERLSDAQSSNGLAYTLENSSLQSERVIEIATAIAQGKIVDMIIEQEGWGIRATEKIQNFYNNYFKLEEQYNARQRDSLIAPPYTLKYWDKLAITETVAQEMGIIESTDGNNFNSMQSLFENILGAFYNISAYSSFYKSIDSGSLKSEKFTCIGNSELLLKKYRKLLGYLNFYKDMITFEEYQAIVDN
jgi:hypothetical protein